MLTSILRLAALRVADKSPPLGVPGGPCQVTQRIRDSIRNPSLQRELLEDIERNKELSNSDASKVYTFEVERTQGVAKRISISAHAQYRMDLRGITVKDVQAALQGLSKLYFTFKSQQGPRFKSLDQSLRSGKPYLWSDPKTGLSIVVVMRGDDAVLVTAYWEGKSDPVARPGQCTF